MERSRTHVSCIQDFQQLRLGDGTSVDYAELAAADQIDDRTTSQWAGLIDVAANQPVIIPHPAPAA